MVWEATDLLSNKLLLKLYSVWLKEEIMVVKSTSNWLLEKIKLWFLEKMAKSDTSSSCVQLYRKTKCCLFLKFCLRYLKEIWDLTWQSYRYVLLCRLCSSRKHSLIPSPQKGLEFPGWGGGGAGDWLRDWWGGWSLE